MRRMIRYIYSLHVSDYGVCGSIVVVKPACVQTFNSQSSSSSSSSFFSCSLPTTFSPCHVGAMWVPFMNSAIYLNIGHLSKPRLLIDMLPIIARRWRLGHVIVQAAGRLIWEYADFDSSRESVPDEIINLKAPDAPEGTGKIIEVKRSSVLRSPALARLINSKHYLDGSDMILTFLYDPAVCLEIARSYLDEGPDRYTKTRLRAYLFSRYNIVDRFRIHCRVYLLAKKLGLPGLMEIAYGCLEDAERLMKPSHCIAVTSLVFGAQSGFDKLIKDWCMKHVRIHLTVLHMERKWNQLLPRLESNFKAQYARLVEDNAAILTAIEEEAEERALEEEMNQIERERQAAVVPATERSRSETSVVEITDSVRREHQDDPNGEEWEDIERQTPRDDRAVVRSRKKMKRGKLNNSRASKLQAKTRTPMPDTPSAKAREFLGIDQDADNTYRRRVSAYGKRLTRFLHSKH